MKVFVTGSTGAIGAALLPRLVASGHEVLAQMRDERKRGWAEGLGAKAVVVDPLDAEALRRSVLEHAPEAIVHELTALRGVGNFKKFNQEFALTNRFRSEVTDTLLAAGAAAGTRRLLAQSFCGWPFAREGGPVKTEEDPLDPEPPSSFREVLRAIRHLEDAVLASERVEALALRYGMFYGPGSGIAEEGPIVAAIRARKLPLVGDGAGVWSFVHIEDAAAATVQALEQGAPGLYNVVDDDPSPVAQWLPHLAQAVGAPAPRRVPVWLAKFAIGEGGVSMMTRIRGGSNAKAKRELRWAPLYSSWREGFVRGMR